MGDVCALIADVSAEYGIATGQEANLATLRFATEGVGGGFRVRVDVLPRKPRLAVPVSHLASLRGFRKVPNKDNTFVSPFLQCKENQAPEKVRDHLLANCLYFSDDGVPGTALCNRAFPMPEEFPIALLFFYMSSVVRYKPEFLSRIRESRWWPVLLAARRHCLFKFMLLFWSFVHKEQYVVNSSEPYSRMPG